MTREEAKGYLTQLKHWKFVPDNLADEALEMAIGALEQELCDDCISRQALDEIKELMTDINGDTVYAVRMSNIRQLPSVTPQPKIGRWLEMEEFIKKNYELVEDKPGYVWFNKRNLQIIKIEYLAELLKRWWSSSHSSLHSISNEFQESEG